MVMVNQRAANIAGRLQLSELPSIAIGRCKEIANCPAVYLVVGKRDEVLYVGETIHLALRFLAHKMTTLSNQRKAKRIHWLELQGRDVNLRQDIEQELIARFSPEYNGVRDIEALKPDRKCLRCEHEWKSRRSIQLRCPKCSSVNWNKAVAAKKGGGK